MRPPATNGSIDCDPLIPGLGTAEQHAVELGPLVEQLKVVLPGVADGAVHGECGVGQFGAVPGDLRLGRGGMQSGVGAAVLKRRRRQQTLWSRRTRR